MFLSPPRRYTGRRRVDWEAIAADLINTELTQAAIAKKHHVSPRTVHNVKVAYRIERPAKSKPHTEAIIADLKDNELTLEQIAARHNVAYHTVWRIKKRAGIEREAVYTRRQKRLTNDEKQAVIRALIDGDSQPQIAAQYGVSTTTIANIRREAGIVETGSVRARRNRRQAIEADLRLMAETEQTGQQIAEAHGVSASYVSQIKRATGSEPGNYSSNGTLEERLQRVENLHIPTD